MPHLVRPIHTPLDAGVSIGVVLSQVKDAHQYLSQLGMTAVTLASEPKDLAVWGTKMKRVRITFTDDRPALVSHDHIEHSLIEIINQCATMERLIDTLKWCIVNLSDYRVIRCHPTTSSDKAEKSDIPDNDIVLVNTLGQLARFEISDVSSSTKDGNGKERKDLTSLGVHWVNTNDDYIDNPSLFDNRLFMVVSSDFGTYIRRRLKSYYPKNQPYFRYQEHDIDGATALFEILSAT